MTEIKLILKHRWNKDKNSAFDGASSNCIPDSLYAVNKTIAPIQAFCLMQHLEQFSRTFLCHIERETQSF